MRKAWSPRARGVAAVVLSGLGYGFLGLLGKAAFRAGLSGGENLALRFLCSAALLGLWTAASDWRSLRLQPKALLACAVLGLAGYAVFSSFYFAALQGLSASLTVLLLYTYPVMVALGGWILLGERPGRRILWSLPVVAAGLLLLISGDFAVKTWAALVFGIGAAVIYSLYILASSRWLSGVSPLVASTYIQAFAGLGLAAVYLHDGARLGEIVRAAWWIVPVTAVVATAMPMVFFLNGLKTLTASEVSMLSTVEPVTGVVLAALVLGESLRPEQFLGGGLVLGVLLWTAREGERKIAPDCGHGATLEAAPRPREK